MCPAMEMNVQGTQNVQFLRPWILLLLQIHSQKRRTGVIAPKRFVQRLKKDNELFRSYMHQVRAALSLLYRWAI